MHVKRVDINQNKHELKSETKIKKKYQTGKSRYFNEYKFDRFILKPFNEYCASEAIEIEANSL